MSYQRGSLKKVSRQEGETWVLRFRVTNAEGKRVEHTMPVGLVLRFPKDKDAWREVSVTASSLPCPCVPNNSQKCRDRAEVSHTGFRPSCLSASRATLVA